MVLDDEAGETRSQGGESDAYANGTASATEESSPHNGEAEDEADFDEAGGKWVFEGEEQGGAMEYEQGEDPAEEAYNDDYQPVFDPEAAGPGDDEDDEDERLALASKDLWSKAVETGKLAYAEAANTGKDEVLYEVDPG